MVSGHNHLAVEGLQWVEGRPVVPSVGLIEWVNCAGGLHRHTHAESTGELVQLASPAGVVVRAGQAAIVCGTVAVSRGFVEEVVSHAPIRSVQLLHSGCALLEGTGSGREGVIGRVSIVHVDVRRTPLVVHGYVTRAASA